MRSIRTATRDAGAATLWLALGASGSAGGLVTVCGTDVAAGGLNFAAALAGGGQVEFACAGSIEITQTHTLNAITTIKGANQVVLRARPAVKMFEAGPAAQRVSIEAITLVGASDVEQGGVFDGAASLLELADVTVRDSGYSPGRALGHARGFVMRANEFKVYRSRFIANQGNVLYGPALHAYDSEFRDNTGAPFLPHFVDEGAIAVVADCQFVHNDRALWIGELFVERSTFVRNGRGSAYGGALAVRGKARIANTEFGHNTAPNGGALWLAGGSLELHGSRLHDNVASVGGGALAVAPAAPGPTTVTLRHVTFKQNRAAIGGALNVEHEGAQPPRIDAVAVSFLENSASERGGGIHVVDADVRLARAFFLGNDGGAFGGAMSAIQPRDARLGCANCIIANNRAKRGAAYYGHGARFVNSTIAMNGGAGVAAPENKLVPAWDPQQVDLPSPIQFQNTIVWGGFWNACAEQTPLGPYEDLGHNLQFPGGHCGTSIPMRFPFLGKRLVPMPFSAAIEGGDDAACAALPVNGHDVYGVVRPLTGICTIGAVEGNVSHLEERYRRRERETPAAGR